MSEFQLLINGNGVDGSRLLAVDEPIRGRTVFQVHLPSEDQIDAAVAAARAAFEPFSDGPAHARAKILRDVAVLLQRDGDTFIDDLVQGVGKAYSSAKGEVERAVETLNAAAEEAVRILGFEVPLDASPRGEGRLGFVRRYPIGVVAAITPFNSPLNTVCHKLAPAIAAGNTVVLKPDLSGSAVAVRLANLFAEAGLPDGVLNVIHGGATEGESLVRHDDVDVITFTGSEAVGERITSIAGLKKVLLELGGNAPVIVHDDADLAATVDSLIPASFGLSGQSCISVQRIFVHERIFDRFLDSFLDRVEGLKMGDPADPATDLGPVVSERAAERIQSWVDEAVAGGATLRAGGPRKGTYVTPTVLTDVTPDMKTMCMEVFGPVVNVIPYSDVDQAIDAANSTRYGLQAGVFTNRMDIVLKAMRRLKFGGVIVNDPSRWRLDHMPYGGVKRSGTGREGPKYAIEDMTELRLIVVH